MSSPQWIKVLTAYGALLASLRFIRSNGVVHVTHCMVRLCYHGVGIGARVGARSGKGCGLSVSTAAIVGRAGTVHMAPAERIHV